MISEDRCWNQHLKKSGSTSFLGLQKGSKEKIFLTHDAHYIFSFTLGQKPCDSHIYLYDEVQKLSYLVLGTLEIVRGSKMQNEDCKSDACLSPCLPSQTTASMRTGPCLHNFLVYSQGPPWCFPRETLSNCLWNESWLSPLLWEDVCCLLKAKKRCWLHCFCYHLTFIK